MAKKFRIDELMIKRALAADISAARALIMSGIVFINEQRVDSGAVKVLEDTYIDVRDKSLKYVSRGGLKLEKAMMTFPINLKDKICMDIGASTGGFTDCMLQNGAKKVFCVDVGYGQLAWRLRSDERVVNFERTNIKTVNLQMLGTPINFASIDVSFISLRQVFSATREFMSQGGQITALIKPQFEAKREEVGEKGVVRDPEVHKSVISNVLSFATDYNLSPTHLTFSPIKGPEGNIEYLCLLSVDENPKCDITDEQIASIVADAHSQALSRH